MATAPAAAPNALIAALRAGTPGLPAGSASTYSFLPNIAPTYAPRAPRAPRASTLLQVPTLQYTPVAPPPPAYVPPPVERPYVPNEPSFPNIPSFSVNPQPAPAPVPAPAPRVETFPVPDAGEIDIVDLPPLDPVAESFPVVVQQPPRSFDLQPLASYKPPPQPTPAPEPELVDPPQGEIDVTPLGSSQPARDAILNTGNITNVGDPLDELDYFDIPTPEVVAPSVPPVALAPAPAPEPEPAPAPDPAPVYDEIPQGEIDVTPLGTSQPARDAIQNIGDITVVDDPLTELGFIDLPTPQIDVPIIAPESIVQPTPSVTVNEAEVTDTPAVVTDPLDDFELDRELGIVQQSDVPMLQTAPSVPQQSIVEPTPSVTVNEVPVTDAQPVVSDPVADFELDRELGLVPQWDIPELQQNTYDFGNFNDIESQIIFDNLLAELGMIELPTYSIEAPSLGGGYISDWEGGGGGGGRWWEFADVREQ